MELLEKLGTLAVMWGVGYAQKKLPGVNHRATGIPSNVLLGQGAAVLMGGSPQEGVELTVAVEAGLNGAKGAVHAGKALWGLLGRLRR